MPELAHDVALSRALLMILSAVLLGALVLLVLGALYARLRDDRRERARPGGTPRAKGPASRRRNDETGRAA